MPALEIDSHGVPTVGTFAVFLQQLLDHAAAVKPTTDIDPAISKSDLESVYSRIDSIFGLAEDPKNRKYAIVETAARDLFGNLIATTSIDSPDFVRVWNLFDILSIFADNGHCDPPLLFWLIEELLDSQTIAGCRKVFDYLESRRERVTADHFGGKKLVILRSCNDLLRRLSRAEDTPFCGRVFIFLFQVFPLGDKSSVNLRGEYHVENVTAYDAIPKEADDGEKMDVDGTDSKPDGKVDFDALYPVFWSLQTSFSQPKTLFDPASFAQFKAGLETTLAAFRTIHDERRRDGRHTDDARRGAKRKRDRDELTDTYNPKYLTSRDLFQLETSDLTFQRHFLLQALIIVEFLLSLSPRARKKLATASTPNKSVTYSDHVLSEDDTASVIKMKHAITEHIKNSADDGPYFFRMVDTILARDKNWVRWKVESCQSIERPGVTAEVFVGAKESAQRAFARHRRRNNMLPMGALSLDFLDDGADDGDALEKLKDPKRFALPLLGFFEKEIAEEDLEMEMPDSEQSKMQAEERKASKTWRALRIARQSRLAVFDRIDSDKNISVVFAAEGTGGTGDADAAAGDDDADVPLNKDGLPQDTRPVVLVSLDEAAAENASRLLLARNPGVFVVVGQHTTRPAAKGEGAVEGEGEDGEKSATKTKTRNHHVDAKAFNMLLDGDRFVCFSEVGDVLYGTQKALVDAVTDTGKVPLVLMNYASVQLAKDNAFGARYVFVRPTSVEAVEAQRQAGGQEAEAQTILAAADGLFDKVLVDDDAESTAKQLEAYVYELDEAMEGVEAGKTGAAETDKTTDKTQEPTGETDAAMTDAPASGEATKEA